MPIDILSVKVKLKQTSALKRFIDFLLLLLLFYLGCAKCTSINLTQHYDLHIIVLNALVCFALVRICYLNLVQGFTCSA